jgi:hypothetical protein
MHELLTILDAMLARRDEIADRRELLLDVGERVVKTIAAVFGAKTDEVAILLLTTDGRELRFIAPRKLAELGSLPLTKRDAIAVSVFLRKTGEANNNVPLVRHVSFFESVKIKDRVAPIQKMVTVPILHGERPIGVAQISRKGASPREAGPDFQQGDVHKAQELFATLAARLVAARPPTF